MSFVIFKNANIPCEFFIVGENNNGKPNIPALWLSQYTMAVVANSPDHQQHLHYQQPTKY